MPQQETFARSLPVVRTGCPLVGFGLLPERLGVQLPGVLGSLASRLRTVGVPKALLPPGRLLVQLLGAAVGGKLTGPRSRSTFPRSRHLIRFVHRHPCSLREWLSSLRQLPEHDQSEGCLSQHDCDLPGTVCARVRRLPSCRQLNPSGQLVS